MHLSDEDMRLQKKEWRLAGVCFSHDHHLITVREDEKHHKYIRQELAMRLGADAWYYEGYIDSKTLKFVERGR